MKRIKLIEEHINIGQVVREFGNARIREVKEGNYRIIYRIESEEEVSIARIYHSARLLKKL